jgi:hypothetical protein
VLPTVAGNNAVSRPLPPPVEVWDGLLEVLLDEPPDEGADDVELAAEPQPRSRSPVASRAAVDLNPSPAARKRLMWHLPIAAIWAIDDSKHEPAMAGVHLLD